MAGGSRRVRRAGGRCDGAAGTVSAARGAWDPTEVLPRFSRMLELEVVAGVLVITVAGTLGSISPPGKDGAQRLTTAQVRALLSPHLPTTDISNWTDTDDSPESTIDDLHYSEFTHREVVA